MISAPFRYPLSRTMLASGEIHLWCIDLNHSGSELQMLAHTLSADELARARRFHFENDRTHFVLRRGILRIYLSSYLDVAPNLLRFAHGKNGKPALVDTFGKGALFFNLSHSNGMVLYAFTRDGEIGVDIEQNRAMDDFQSIAARFFSPTEYETWAGLPDDKRQEAFFNCWTRKEAFVKALGDGLARPLNSFDVSLVPGEPARLLNMADDAGESSQWSVQALRPAPNYVAACAIKRQDF